jgi:hypothetical protein
MQPIIAVIAGMTLSIYLYNHQLAKGKQHKHVQEQIAKPMEPARQPIGDTTLILPVKKNW